MPCTYCDINTENWSSVGLKTVIYKPK